jgi:hypothetical protein
MANKIKREEEADPVWVELPPDIQKRFNRRLAACEAAWLETNDPLVVAEAITWVHCFRQTIPQWLEAAAVQALSKVRTKAQAKRYVEDREHWRRWCLVKDLTEDNRARTGRRLWVDARKRASAILSCDESTVKASYDRVQADLRARRPDRYHLLKDRRYFQGK